MIAHTIAQSNVSNSAKPLEWWVVKKCSRSGADVCANRLDEWLLADLLVILRKWLGAESCITAKYIHMYVCKCACKYSTSLPLQQHRTRVSLSAAWVGSLSTPKRGTLPLLLLLYSNLICSTVGANADVDVMTLLLLLLLPNLSCVRMMKSYNNAKQQKQQQQCCRCWLNK